MADNTTGQPTISTSTPLMYQEFNQTADPFKGVPGPFNAGFSSLELRSSGTPNSSSRNSFIGSGSKLSEEINSEVAAAAAASQNSLGSPIAPTSTASLDNGSSIAPIALANWLSSSANRQSSDPGATEPFNVSYNSTRFPQNHSKHGDTPIGASVGGDIDLLHSKPPEHQHASSTAPHTTETATSSLQPASVSSTNNQASSANGTFSAGVASSNSPVIINKPVLKMKRTGQNFPLSSSTGSLHYRNRSYSPSQRQGSLTPRGSATGKSSALVTQGVQQPANGGIPKSLGEEPSGKFSPALKVDPGQGLGLKEDSTLKDSPAISTRSSINDRGNGKISPAIQDSDSDYIIYETAAQVGAVEGDLENVIDHQSSSDESDSQSEDNDETVEMDVGEASFRQLFRPPDQEDDFDDSEDASADGEDEDTTSESSSDDDDDTIAEEPTVALPSAKIQHQEVYPSTILELAEPGRLYTQYRDKGVTLKAGPAMFPVGYTQSDVKAFPWICAVRSCRLVYKTLTGLANHAKLTHKKAMFNDNMDGTVSLVGSYSKKNQSGHYPPVIVSKRLLDPEEPQIREPTNPLRNHASSKIRSNVEELSQSAVSNVNDVVMGDGNAEALEQEDNPGTPPMADPRTSEQMWEYIRPFLSKHTSIPNINWARHIMHLPRVRDIKWNEDRNKEWPYKDSHPRDITALIVQVTGVESASPCDQCLRGRGPFIGCIVVSPDASDDVKSAVLSCANCYYHCGQSSCSLCKSAVARKERRSGFRIGQKPDSYNVRLLSDVAHRKSTKATMGQAQAFPKSPASLEAPVQPNLKLYLPSEIKVIEKASSERSYKVIKGLNGADVPMCGALIPEKYDLDRTVPGYPWICPIRSCRRVFNKIVSLGPHFARQHAGSLLNDNQDGTLSQIQYYDIPLPGNTSLPPLVISQNPLNPEEPPMETPGLPGQGGHAPKISKRRIITNKLHGATRTRSRDLTISDSKELWNYMRPYLPQSLTSISSNDSVLRLLDLPRQREIQWRTKMHQVKVSDDRRQIVGMVIYLTGEKHKNGEKSCTNCVKRNGPFPSCMTLTNDVPENAKSLVQACANCVFTNNSSSCSIKSGLSKYAGERSQPEVNAKKRALSIDDEGDALATSRRRSNKLGFSDEEDKTEHRKKIVTLSLKRYGQTPGSYEATQLPSQTRATSNGGAMKDLPSTALIHAGQFQPDEMLEMEDWEISPGRIRGAGADVNNNIAFSKSYLETNQAVRVSRDVTFEVRSIKSGHNLELEADRTKTRYCTLASGKLYVNVEDQEPFTIGPHGLFKVAPGSTAKIQNRLYIDSVLHISTYADG